MKKKALLIISLILSMNQAFSAEQPQQMIFVCGGNTGRSPMAEYLANDHFGFPAEGYIAISRAASLDPTAITPEKNAIQAMLEKPFNINISLHRAQQLTAQDVKNSDYVLTMTKAQKQKILTTIDPDDRNTSNKVYMLSECANGTQVDVPDAWGKNLETYEKTRDQIAGYIQKIQQRISKKQKPCLS